MTEMTKVDPRTRPKAPPAAPASSKAAQEEGRGRDDRDSRRTADATIAAERAVAAAARTAGYVYPEDMYKIVEMQKIIGAADPGRAARDEVSAVRTRCPNLFDTQRPIPGRPVSNQYEGGGGPGARARADAEIRREMIRSGNYVKM
jgi:hypothetical protein